MLYIRYRIHLTEAGRSNPEKVKHRLCELLGEDIFAHLSVNTHTAIRNGEAHSVTVLEAGIEMTPGTKTALIGNAQFSEFATRLDDVASVERLSGA